MKFLRFSFPGIENVSCAFSTRLGGASPGEFYSNNISFEVGDQEDNVLKNRESIKMELGFQMLVELKQIHGTDIHFDLQDENADHADIRGDGAGISGPGAAVMIKTADCQPVFLVHESGRYACGLHVGWRGNRDDFPGKGVKRFCEHYRISPDEVLTVRGPSLGPCCSRFDRFDEHWTDVFYRYYDNQLKTINLWSITRDQLKNAGIRPDRIFCLDLCTRCLDDLFFSYRRSRNCGRQGSYIMIH